MDNIEFEQRLRELLHSANLNQYDAADVLEDIAHEQRLEGDDREEA